MDQISKSIQRQMRQLIFTFCCLFFMLDGHSQSKETKVEDNLIFEGNELHESETYAQAEKKYREALARAPKNTIAQHNLGILSLTNLILERPLMPTNLPQ